LSETSENVSANNSHKISPSFKTLLFKATTATDTMCARNIEGFSFNGIFVMVFWF